MTASNMPEIKMGLVGVSRDCFPIELSRERTRRVSDECAKIGLDVTTCTVIIESEADAMKAAAEMRAGGVNAVAVYLGNFGPEGPLTIFARELGVPFMLAGAAEESTSTLVGGRGDAYCGMLNASLNCGLRNLEPHIPAMPIGLPAEVAKEIAHFAGVARVVVGVRNLKIFAFGPRPHDFYACNAPIGPLYDLGVEVMESSELDMLELYKSVADRKSDIDAIAADMAEELGAGNKLPGKLPQLAQFELALTTFMEENLGSRSFGVFADKCWPAFEAAFGFVPCYVNSRLAGRGIPAACEVDMYGAVSEYMCYLATQSAPTLLDINNSVPADMKIDDLLGAAREDLFMGFHCGNTPSSCLAAGFEMKFQLIMKRLMEPDSDPDITCGTLEGRLKPGPVTVYRLQARADNHVQSYAAQGNVADVDPQSFGGIGVIAVPGFGRIYRHILVGRQYPHHAAIAFDHCGRTLFDATKLLGVDEVASPLPAGTLYEGENPFA